MKLLKCLFFLLSLCAVKVDAQNTLKLDYTRQNTFVNNSNKIEMAANIAGTHHLLSFTNTEEPVIYIFNDDLTFKQKISIPFKFEEKSEVHITAFTDFYFLCIRAPYTSKYFFWKIDGTGNVTDMSAAFENLLRSQSHNIKLGFQLIVKENQLYMVYHTSLDDVEKRTLVIVQTDSLLHINFSHQVAYDFKRYEEKLQQEILVLGRYVLVLKTLRSSTALEIMKVNLATGYTIKNTFYSSGYLYSQSSISLSNSDSSITVTSLLSPPDVTSLKRFVFISRLNKILVEEVPFSILKSQFEKNTGTNFLLVKQSGKWVRIKSEFWQRSYPAEESISLYRDYKIPDSSNNYSIAPPPARTNSYRYSHSDYGNVGIRFSLLDKDFKIINERYVSNTKNSYTISPGQFTRFGFNSREYMLVGQRFYNKINGLLLINTDDIGQLIYTDVRVHDRNEYLLSKLQVVPNKGVILPYVRKHEAGLVKITIE